MRKRVLATLMTAAMAATLSLAVVTQQELILQQQVATQLQLQRAALQRQQAVTTNLRLS